MAPKGLLKHFIFVLQYICQYFVGMADPGTLGEQHQAKFFLTSEKVNIFVISALVWSSKHLKFNSDKNFGNG